METLGDALPREIERVRGVRDLYIELRGMPNVIVEPQIAMLDHALNQAVKAIAEGDVVQQLRSFKELKDWQA